MATEINIQELTEEDIAATDLPEKFNGNFGNLTQELISHIDNKENPHNVTAEQLGLTNAYVYKGSVATYQDLLAIQNPENGWVYDVQQEDKELEIAAGSNFAWNGTSWDNLGGKLSGLVKTVNDIAPNDNGNVDLNLKFFNSLEQVGLNLSTVTWNSLYEALPSNSQIMFNASGETGSSIYAPNLELPLGNGVITAIKKDPSSVMSTKFAQNTGNDSRYIEQIGRYSGATKNFVGWFIVPKSVNGILPSDLGDISLPPFFSLEPYTSGKDATLKVINSNDDLNNYTTAGNYYCASATIAQTLKNTPYTSGNFRFVVLINTNNVSGIYGTQFIFSFNNKIYFRTIRGVAPTFDKWQELVTADADVAADYVTETYVKGDSWYRKYKSGWVEQGGKATSAAGTVINLLLPMAGRGYFSSAVDVGSGAYSFGVYAQSTTQIVVYGGTSTTNYHWAVFGKGA